MRARSCLFAIVLAACGPVGERCDETCSPPYGATGTTSSTTENSGSTGTPVTSSEGGLDSSSTTTESIDPTTTGEDSSSSSGETGGMPYVCSLYRQDCPDGEKCMPYVTEDYTSYACFPIARNPDQLGEPCTADDSVWGGQDSCDLNLICWYVDPETLEGECTSFCYEPGHSCEDPSAFCVVPADGPGICIPSCDPLAQDCPRSSGCYPYSGIFLCMDDASGDGGSHGAACEHVQFCDPGLFCSAAATVPGCTSAYCCTHLCDLSADPTTQCLEGSADGQECVPWYGESTAPDAYVNVGACMLPS